MISKESREIKIKAQPSNDPSVCSFKVEELYVGRMIHCASPCSAKDPLVVSLMDIDGVKEVLINDKLVTVSKGDSSRNWSELGSDIGGLLRTKILSGEDLFLDESEIEAEMESEGECSHCQCGSQQNRCHDSDSDAKVDDQTLSASITKILAEDINPQVAGHGGRIDLVKVEKGDVFLRMEGGCQGCHMAQETLRGGVERHLRSVVPGIRSIIDVTTHSEGVNPYYTPEN